MILILIFIMEIWEKKKPTHWFRTTWLANVWQLQCLSQAFQHVIYAMFLPVNRILFILSGKRAITDCLLCLDTERFLLLWPLFSAAVSVSISQLECSNFWIACQEITPFLHSCNFTVTYLTGKREVLNYWHFAWYLDTSYSQISLVKFNSLLLHLHISWVTFHPIFTYDFIQI